MLQDYLAHGLRVVFCGTAAGKVSASRGHYYAGPGNEFWRALHASGIVPVSIGPSLDHRVLEFGVGLTDLAKGVASSSDRGLRSQYDVSSFVAKMETYRPVWIAFHGKEAAKAVARSLQSGTDIRLGTQQWGVGSSRVFVVPSMSAANRDPGRLEQKVSREEWFRDLATLLPPSVQSG